MGIGSAAAAGLIKSATVVEREQRSALPNQVSKLTFKGCVKQASNDLPSCYFFFKLVVIMMHYFVCRKLIMAIIRSQTMPTSITSSTLMMDQQEVLIICLKILMNPISRCHSPIMLA